MHDNLFESPGTVRPRPRAGEQAPCALCGGRSYQCSTGALLRAGRARHRRGRDRAFNPLLHRGVRFLGALTPSGLRQRPLRVPVGELLIVASA